MPEAQVSNIVTAEQIGARLINNELLPAERRFRKLPIFVKEKLTCKCQINWCEDSNDDSVPGYRGYLTLTPSGTTTRGSASYCTICKLPHRFSVADVVKICEGCDNYYVPDTTKLRDSRERYFLCQACDVPARPRRRIKRGSVRFS